MWRCTSNVAAHGKMACSPCMHDSAREAGVCRMTGCEFRIGAPQISGKRSWAVRPSRGGEPRTAVGCGAGSDPTVRRSEHLPGQHHADRRARLVQPSVRGAAADAAAVAAHGGRCRHLGRLPCGLPLCCQSRHQGIHPAIHSASTERRAQVRQKTLGSRKGASSSTSTAGRGRRATSRQDAEPPQPGTSAAACTVGKGHLADSAPSRSRRWLTAASG